jgi:hypothetical protein
VDDIMKDIHEFNHVYMNKTHNEIEQIRWALANAYKNAHAKMILNYGSTVVPVAKHWAKLLKYV